MAELGKVAEWYARALQWAVLPLHSPQGGSTCSCGRLGCSSVGKHPRTPHGVHDATKDLTQIREWWSQWPDANIGVATGAVSGLIVVDIEPSNDGNSTFHDLAQAYKSEIASVRARTGGGGRHLYYTYQETPLLAKPGSGIDVKADGGYVAVAPSLHVSGKRYAWLTWIGPDAALRPVPRWVLDRGRGEPYSGKKQAINPKQVLHEGERDNELIRIAGQQRQFGYSEAEIYALLEAHNRMFCEPPLPDVDIRRLAHSSMRWEPDQLAAATVDTDDVWPRRRRSSKRRAW